MDGIDNPTTANRSAVQQDAAGPGVSVARKAPQLPADYKPENARKAIDVAEMLEKHYRRAKDLEQLYKAVEAKLTEQRRFVLWWDEQLKQQGARGSGSNQYQLVASQNGYATKLEKLGIDRMTVHRWRKRLADDARFNTTLDAARERCRRVCEAERGSTEQKGASGTGDNEWYTPLIYISAARSVLGTIDLDPASSDKAQEEIRATEYFTPEVDGLTQEWHGNVWLNPPYAQPYIAQFVSKLVEEISKGHTTEAVLLTHNYTDTAWFHDAASMCDAICFTRGRIRFYSAEGDLAAPTQGQAFFYFGPNVGRFAARFREIGFVVLPFADGTSLEVEAA